MIQQPRKVHRRAVREVSTLREVEPEHGLTRLEEGEIDRGVRLRAGVRLHVGMLCPEQQLGPVNCEAFNFVHHLASAVVALSRKALRVLVVQRGAHGFEHRRRDEVLARDQLEAVGLARALFLDELRDLRIDFAQRFTRRTPVPHRPVCHMSSLPSSSSIFSTRRSCRPPSNGVVEPGLQDRNTTFLRYKTRREYQHVGVVVLAGQGRDLGRPGDRRAHVRVAVGHVRHPETRAAHQHTAPGLTLRYPIGERMAEIGIVRRRRRRCPEVLHVVPQRGQGLRDCRLHLEARVVRRDRDPLLHMALISSSGATAARSWSARGRPRRGVRPGHRPLRSSGFPFPSRS